VKTIHLEEGKEIGQRCQHAS